MRLFLRVLLLGIGASAVAAPLFAQCPDGTPPPCRGGTSTGGITRRANPPLDARTWIVVPFENVTRAQDIEWLREASVNLLYLDMSKWRDIRVIDDERVADLVRETPETRGGSAMSLQAGMAVARRAGAGQLVMGDLLKVGSRTRVVAKVFDVRSGQRVRNVIQETDNADSLMGVFGRLARGILNAEPPTEAALGVGTTRLDAYQEYVAGVRALNAFETQEARQRFEAALQLDTAFALAHYKLSIVIGWVSSADPSHRAHADAAARLAGGLPLRERTLITAQAQGASGDYGRSCQTLLPLVRADTNDIEALYNVGECSYHDNGVEALPGDTSRFRFRGNWNTALHAFRHVLELDPTYHLAFQHVQDALWARTRNGCLVVNDQPDCTRPETAFNAAVRRDGDTLLVEPVHTLDAGRLLAAQMGAAATDGSRRRNLEEARHAAADWLAVAPTESRAQIAYARSLLRLGRVEEAAAAVAQVTRPRLSRPEAMTFITDRIEIALKTGNGAEGNRLYDSVVTSFDSVARGNPAVGIVGSIFGHSRRMDTIINRAMTAPPWVRAYFTSQAHALLGLPDDSLIPRERAFVEGLASVPSGRAANAANLLVGSIAYTLRARTADQVLATDTANPDPRIRLMSRFASADTSRFRVALVELDAAIDASRDDGDHAMSIVSAEAHLVLHDTAGALARLRVFRDVVWRSTPLLDQVAPGFGQTGMLWPRSFLLLGDLAAASGERDEAAAAYRRFIGMWEHGDADTQPTVQRARAALASLGN